MHSYRFYRYVASKLATATIYIYALPCYLVTVLLEYIDSFVATSHKCIKIINVFYYNAGIICLMLSATHYTQYYAGIISGPLYLATIINYTLCMHLIVTASELQ